MSLPRCCFALVAAFCFAAGPGRAAEDAAALVDEILAKPGVFRQACGFIVVGEGKELSLPINGLLGRSESRISPENIARLRGERVAVIEDLVGRLKKVQSGVESRGRSTVDDGVLAMLLDLNATEALPELIRIEALIRAEVMASASIGKDAEYDGRRIQLRLGQRDVLGVIATILRQEKYPPFLESGLEKAYQRALKDRTQNSELSIRRSDADLTENQLRYIYFDPVSGVPASSFNAIEVPCDEAVVKQVLAFAAEYVAKVPEGDRKGAAGMSPRVLTR